MRRVLLYFVMLVPLLWTSSLWSQDEKIEEETRARPRMLIDLPTANLLRLRNFVLSLRLYDEGGMLAKLTVGLTQRLMFGVTYGGQNVVGVGPVLWNPSPGIHLRYRIKFESYKFPAVAIGFDSQGYGPYKEDLERYTIKSRGFFFVLSKNYTFLKSMGFHGGLNYSLEKTAGDNDVNLFCGAHLILDPELSFLWEYDFAINDNDDNSLGSGKGYMNAAIRWIFAKHLTIEFSIKNLLRNREDVPHSNREMKIIYVQAF